MLRAIEEREVKEREEKKRRAVAVIISRYASLSLEELEKTAPEEMLDVFRADIVLYDKTLSTEHIAVVFLEKGKALVMRREDGKIEEVRETTLPVPELFTKIYSKKYSAVIRGFAGADTPVPENSVLVAKCSAPEQEIHALK